MKFAMILPGKKLEDAIQTSYMLVDAFDRFGWKFQAEAFGMHFQTGRILVQALVPDDETELKNPDCLKEVAILQYRYRWYEDPDQRGCVVLRYEGKNILYYVREYARERGMNWMEYPRDGGGDHIGERVYVREQLIQPVTENAIS